MSDFISTVGLDIWWYVNISRQLRLDYGLFYIVGMNAGYLTAKWPIMLYMYVPDGFVSC